MPFDPKLIRADAAPLDDAGEIELPDDLLELAAQLRDDATYLAERYPAEPAPLLTPLPLAAPVRRVRWHWVGTAAAALLAMLAATYRPANMVPEPTPAVSVAAALPPASASAPRSTAPSSTGATTETFITAPAGPRIERLPWAPETVVPSVSGPELEGLLDLWQNDGQELEPISI